MPAQTEIIERERQFWTAPAAYFEQGLANGALLVFPPPVGILARDAAIAGLRSGPRWASVELSDVIFNESGRDVLLLAYRARAQRNGATADYVAMVGSVYLREGGEWKLAFHQHTPC